ncbi:MAG: xanthine dehydrogenase small subunit [Burkholderiales bacterium]|nr:xanthine dehydrogenase small subunit [Burkholderiales bacterium]
MSESPLPIPPRPVRFHYQGREQQVSGLPPTTTVLQWLRDHAHCTGTKEGCAEGDCGACTVVVGEINAQGQWTQKTVNSCIQFLPTLDGKALLTVEDVAQGDQLHPCQQAMVDCHGSQCGFCTPGFVMSLWHVYQTHEQPLPRPALADALAGNLCRCTGYRPILDAGEKMFEAPRVVPDHQDAIAALKSWSRQANQPFMYVGPSQVHGGQAQRFVSPTTLDELAYWREQWPHARLLAGGTDVGLWVTKQFKDLGDIIYLGQVRALTDIHRSATQWEIGAGVSLETAWQALVELEPHLKEIWLRFASPPVRHAGTLGGNVANGSPIGDGAPVLLALNASLVLRKGAKTREVPLTAFYLDYMKNLLEPGEWLQSIRVPVPDPTQPEVRRAYKISKRRDSDISAVCGAFTLRFDGDTIIEARLAWGGLAATAKRSAQAEAALLGRAWSEATLRLAQAALQQDFTPLTDLRASDRYRLRVATNLLERFWLETRLPNPLPAEQVQVWPPVVTGAQP